MYEICVVINLFRQPMYRLFFGGAYVHELNLGPFWALEKEKRNECVDAHLFLLNELRTPIFRTRFFVLLNSQNKMLVDYLTIMALNIILFQNKPLNFNVRKI